MMEGQKVKWELFNLTTDPREKHDVAKEHPEIVAEMQKGLEAWLDSVANSLNGDDYGS